jgi:hypothetical protein
MRASAIPGKCWRTMGSSSAAISSAAGRLDAAGADELIVV